jgi:signal transduction histidine kinase
VQKLSDAAVEISDLIQDLTTYTTLGKAEEQQTFSEISIANILQKVHQAHAEEMAQLSAQLELPEDLPNVEGNPIQLHLLFTHLMSNSLKFARADEPLRIQLSASQVEGYEIPGVEDSDHDYTFYRINFTDNGIGIDKKHMHVIFELFQRLHKDKEVPGTGIGLAICRKIMLNHNGYIVVKSELNRGSTFSLFFPL